MNKKLIAVAVAGVFAAPAAFAQSSVTISGILKGGFESMKYANSAKANPSQTGIVDDSSRIVFNVVEDLGGGLQAIVQLDMRLKADDGNNPAAQNVGGTLVQGNSHWGLRSKDWGRIFFGRQDLHYFNNESNLTDKGDLRATSVSLLAYAGGGGTSITTASRTQNVIHYTTPNWSGFTVIGAYSSNPTGQESDIGSGVRKGRAWNFNPNFAAANWQIGYSYYSSKPDAVLTNKQRGDRFYGSYVFPMGIKVGFAWDKSRIDNEATGVRTSNRNAWSIPVSYTWGNHSVHAHYTKAKDDKATVVDDGAKMWAMSYAYDLSKRTSAALTYARITNNAGASYNLFTAQSLGLATNPTAFIAPGEDPRIWAVTLRHAF